MRRAPFFKPRECAPQQGLPDFCAEFYEDTQMQHKRNFQIAIWFFIMRNIAAMQNKSPFYAAMQHPHVRHPLATSGFPKRPAD
ncbi:conserved hypothethical protein [Ralstonia solanacearum PSI07]|uniref:Conserved hypothethical protein n=3 Tax=Ralstonia TaxID=48736 RepID=G3A7A0_9RALS|nr:conserved hypothethical protein [Ralstonia solanacearum PSI07]CCA80008.1 conserved hypothetical protein [blood disease bacterium R229]CCA86372.1 conserved hypothethical protein [Ralstonia syzygii R24]